MRRIIESSRVLVGATIPKGREQGKDEKPPDDRRKRFEIPVLLAARPYFGFAGHVK
jgi:hypothetical protein